MMSRSLSRSASSSTTSSNESMNDQTIIYPRTGKRGVPQQFPRRLYKMLQCESSQSDSQDKLIEWSHSGKAFRISDVSRFSNEILSKYFRTSKFSSFQRNLNLYGFSKVRHGVDTDMYAHPSFLRGRSDLLSQLKKCKNSSSSSSSSQSKKQVLPPGVEPRLPVQTRILRGEVLRGQEEDSMGRVVLQQNSSSKSVPNSHPTIPTQVCHSSSPPSMQWHKPVSFDIPISKDNYQQPQLQPYHQFIPNQEKSCSGLGLLAIAMTYLEGDSLAS